MKNDENEKFQFYFNELDGPEPASFMDADDKTLTKKNAYFGHSYITLTEFFEKHAEAKNFFDKYLSNFDMSVDKFLPENPQEIT